MTYWIIWKIFNEIGMLWHFLSERKIFPHKISFFKKINSGEKMQNNGGLTFSYFSENQIIWVSRVSAPFHLKVLLLVFLQIVITCLALVIHPTIFDNFNEYLLDTWDWWTGRSLRNFYRDWDHLKNWIYIVQYQSFLTNLYFSFPHHHQGSIDFNSINHQNQLSSKTIVEYQDLHEEIIIILEHQSKKSQKKVKIIKP